MFGLIRKVITALLYFSESIVNVANALIKRHVYH